MGLCVNPDETEHRIGFEVHKESVIFYLSGGYPVEILKTDLLKIEGLMNDMIWRHRLVPNAEHEPRRERKP